MALFERLKSFERLDGQSLELAFEIALREPLSAFPFAEA